MLDGMLACCRVDGRSGWRVGRLYGEEALVPLRFLFGGSGQALLCGFQDVVSGGGSRSSTLPLGPRGLLKQKNPLVSSSDPGVSFPPTQPVRQDQ